MREMNLGEFHDVLATYISDIVKNADLSDPDTVLYTEEFDGLIRVLQQRGPAKTKTVFVRESQDVKTLWRQLDFIIKNRDSIRIQ